MWCENGVLLLTGVHMVDRFKEFKRLKNEPLLLAAILAIILFTGYFVVWPVWQLMTVAQPAEYRILV